MNVTTLSQRTVNSEQQTVNSEQWTVNNQVTELDSLGRALAAAEPVIKMNFNMFFLKSG